MSIISIENFGSVSKGKMGKGKLFIIVKICRWNNGFFFVCKSFYLFINVYILNVLDSFYSMGYYNKVSIVD